MACSFLTMNMDAVVHFESIPNSLSHLGLSNISILYRIEVWDKILRQIFGYRYMVTWCKCCLFLVKKALWQWSDVIFWTYETVFAALLFIFTHLFTLLIIIYQKKCHQVNILWNHRQSALQYCLSIDVFGQKYCDVYLFYRLSCFHPLECTTSCQSQPIWSIIINIDWYKTSLSWQVFQLYWPGRPTAVNTRWKTKCAINAQLKIVPNKCTICLRLSNVC